MTISGLVPCFLKLKLILLTTSSPTLVLSNCIWEVVIEALPHAQVIALDRLWSDHNPIPFHCKKSDYGLTHFRLFHSWFNREGFEDLISSEWNSFNQSLLFHDKLKGLKVKIKVWLGGIKSVERIHKEEVLTVLKNLESKIDSNIASLEDRETRIKLLHDIDKIDSFDALDLQQKSRIKWDIEGDKNSKFFHGLINQRRRTNSIHGIMSDGTWITEPLHVKETFLNVFKYKFQPHDPMTDLPSITCPSNLSSFDLDMLEKDVTLEEIKFAVWDCGNDKAPGPDDFTFGFIKRYWELLKNDIMKFVTRFLETKKMPVGSNSSFTTLIPKRYWIRACLKSSRTSVLVNGSPTSEFSVKCGLRQGDHLSPFLFIIVMEGLHMDLMEASQFELIRCIKIGSLDITLSHMFYEDDMVITTEWSSLDMDNIICDLQVFYLASGLKINIHKSNVYGVGVSNNEVHYMAINTGCSPGSFPFIYLGLPIGANMNLTANWKTLLDRFDARLSK
ncbi:RNA-directed DNA polymerase, eukaryota, reverse transcriptase zinc-binding domain protein [Tanacetum coccineum]